MGDDKQTQKLPDLDKLSGLIQVAAARPDGVLFLLTAVIVLVAVVERLGPWRFSASAPLVVMLPVALLVFAAAGAVHVSARHRMRSTLPDSLQGDLPDIAFDPAFLLKALVEGMPPAFIKEVTTSESSQHVVQSMALAQLQRLNDDIPHDAQSAFGAD